MSPNRRDDDNGATRDLRRLLPGAGTAGALVITDTQRVVCRPPAEVAAEHSSDHQLASAEEREDRRHQLRHRSGRKVPVRVQSAGGSPAGGYSSTRLLIHRPWASPDAFRCATPASRSLADDHQSHRDGERHQRHAKREPADSNCVDGGTERRDCRKDVPVVAVDG